MPVASPAPFQPGASSAEKLDEFKRRTARKLDGLRCPEHGKTPRLTFRGASLRDVTVRMSACCGKLMELANRAIAQS